MLSELIEKLNLSTSELKIDESSLMGLTVSELWNEKMQLEKKEEQ
jgi:hypothetical protein